MHLGWSDGLPLVFDLVTRFSTFGGAAKTSRTNVLYDYGW
jgi:hypothetical protein